MIESLSDITMKDFISMLCGDTGVILEKGDEISPEELREAVNELTYKYRMIVSPSSARAGLMEIEDDVKLKSRFLLTNILRTMAAMGKEDKVRVLLADIGRPSVKDVFATLESMRAECEYLQKKSIDMKPGRTARSPSEIRESFDAESAYLMTFFKMQINLSEISAGVYANMVHQAEEQIKQMKKQTR